MNLQNFRGECSAKERVPPCSKGNPQRRGLGTAFLLLTLALELQVSVTHAEYSDLRENCPSELGMAPGYASVSTF